MRNEENSEVNNLTSSDQSNNRFLYFVDNQSQDDNQQPANNIESLTNINSEISHEINSQYQNNVQQSINNLNSSINMNNEIPQEINNQYQNNIQQPINNLNSSVDMNNGIPQEINNQYQNNIQQPINNQSSNKSFKFKWILLLIIVILVIVLLLYVFLGKNKNGNVDKNNQNISNQSSFFIEKDGYYALFSKTGDKITDFIYKYTSSFVNGTALVARDGDYGVINRDGKMVVDFGKYEFMNDVVGLYKACDKNDHCYLLKRDGSVLYDLKNIKLYTNLLSDNVLLLQDTKKKNYMVLNYSGVSMVTFPVKVSDEKLPTIKSLKKYASVYYNNKNYILDVENGKQIASFDSSDLYTISSEDQDMVVTYLFDNNSGKSTYKIIKSGKVYNLDDKCDWINYIDGNLFCSKDNESYKMNSNFELEMTLNDKAVIDNGTYAVVNKDNIKTVSFYSKGSKIKSIDCRDLKKYGMMNKKYYILEAYASPVCNTDSKKYEYYNLNGEKIVDKLFLTSYPFDDNNLAVVSEDNKNYYLINLNGEKVTQDYSRISSWSNYYIVTKNNLEGILDSQGNVIMDCIYSDIKLTEYWDTTYLKLQTQDSKYIVYDLNAKKEIITSNVNPVLNVHYILIKGDKKQYYNYKGKMFLEI